MTSLELYLVDESGIVEKKEIEEEKGWRSKYVEIYKDYMNRIKSSDTLRIMKRVFYN